MNLKTYKFTKPNGCLPADSKLLAEARDRGFYGGRTPYNDLFSSLFFGGGALNLKKGLNEDFKASALPYLKAFMGSFEPKHEEKEAICAMLLSELVEAELDKGID